MEDETMTGTQAALDAGVALAKPAPVTHDVPAWAFTLPKGGTIQVVRAPAPDRAYDHAPGRPSGTYHPATVDAFIEVVQRHAGASSTVWVHPTKGQMVAVFNDDDVDEGPGWRDHRAQLLLAHTNEWNHWKRLDGQQIGQVAFAEHIEDGLLDIVDPEAAVMLEIAQSFHAHSTAAFQSASRLHDGQVQLRYVEDVKASAGASGQLEIPQEFTIAVPPFVGEDRFPMTARLRYRVREGKLTIGYKLDRPERVVEQVLSEMAARLREELAGPVFVGEPAA